MDRGHDLKGVLPLTAAFEERWRNRQDQAATITKILYIVKGFGSLLKKNRSVFLNLIKISELSLYRQTEPDEVLQIKKIKKGAPQQEILPVLQPEQGPVDEHVLVGL